MSSENIDYFHIFRRILMAFLNLCLVNVETFDNLEPKCADKKDMTIKGFTVQEIANELGIPYKTAHKRLETAGIKPLTKEAIYPDSALEAIRNVPGKGRPKKSKPEIETFKILENNQEKM